MDTKEHVNGETRTECDTSEESIHKAERNSFDMPSYSIASAMALITTTKSIRPENIEEVESRRRSSRNPTRLAH